MKVTNLVTRTHVPFLTTQQLQILQVELTDSHKQFMRRISATSRAIRTLGYIECRKNRVWLIVAINRQKNKGDLFLKKLWYCVGGGVVHKKNGFISSVDISVHWPPKRDSKHLKKGFLELDQCFIQLEEQCILLYF